MHYAIYVILCRTTFDGESDVALHETFITLDAAKQYCDLDGVFPSSEWEPTTLSPEATPFLWTREYTNPNFPEDKTVHEIWRMKLREFADEVFDVTPSEQSND